MHHKIEIKVAPYVPRVFPVQIMTDEGEEKELQISFASDGSLPIPAGCRIIGVGPIRRED